MVKPTSRQACVSLNRKPCDRRAFIDSIGLCLKCCTRKNGKEGGGQRCDNTFAWVLAVTPDISCAVNSKDLGLSLHRSCQATKLVALSQPAHLWVSDWLKNPYPPALPLNI